MTKYHLVAHDDAMVYGEIEKKTIPTKLKKIQNLKNKFRITLNCLNEEILPENCHLDDDVLAEIRKKVKKGKKYAWFCAEVVAEFDGVTENSLLNCCNYKNKRSFKASQDYVDLVSKTKEKLQEKLQGLAEFMNTSFRFKKPSEEKVVNHKKLDLTGMDFTGADLTGIDFTDAKFTNANFTGAEFIDADFADADLSDADLSCAYTDQIRLDQ